VSSCRLICLAAITALAPAAAAAQTATAASQPGKAYLAGLRPPHAQHKPAHLKTVQESDRETSHVGERRPAAKTTPLATQRQLAVAAKTKVHRPVPLAQKSVARKSLAQKSLAQKSLAEKINARVAWPGAEPTTAEPVAAEVRTVPDTALQFTNEDTKSVATPAPRSTMGASAAATKPVPPPTIPVTDEHKADPAVVDPTPTATTPAQTEPVDAPPPSQMRVIMPAPNADPVDAPTPSDPSPPSSSSTAQMLATLAGAIAAGIVAWLMLGSRRIARSKQV
jgi:hypothetical protein